MANDSPRKKTNGAAASRRRSTDELLSLALTEEWRTLLENQDSALQLGVATQWGELLQNPVLHQVLTAGESSEVLSLIDEFTAAPYSLAAFNHKMEKAGFGRREQARSLLIYCYVERMRRGQKVTPDDVRRERQTYKTALKAAATYIEADPLIGGDRRFVQIFHDLADIIDGIDEGILDPVLKPVRKLTTALNIRQRDFRLCCLDAAFVIAAAGRHREALAETAKLLRSQHDGGDTHLKLALVEVAGPFVSDACDADWVAALKDWAEDRAKMEKGSADSRAAIRASLQRSLDDEVTRLTRSPPSEDRERLRLAVGASRKKIKAALVEKWRGAAAERMAGDLIATACDRAALSTLRTPTVINDSDE